MFYKQYKNFMLNTFNKNNHLTDRKLKFLKDFILFTYYEIPKFIAIILFSLIFKTIYETLIINLSFILLRTFCQGIHAKTNWQCWIITLLIFIIIPVISKHLMIPNIILIIGYLILFILAAIYSPNDTKKRPFINIKKRILYKYISLIIITFLFSILLFNVSLINQNLFIGSVIATLSYLPITYIIFKQPYYNFKRL